MKFSFRHQRFSPAPIPTLAAFMAVMLTGYLGLWQQGRAVEKAVLQAEFDVRGSEPPVEIGEGIRDTKLRYRQASAHGEWLGSAQIYVDNKVKREVVGYHVITPLKLEGTNSYLLVNRGWIPRGSTYPVPPAVEVVPGRIKVSGQLSVPSNRFLELSSQSIQGNVWQNLTPDRFREAMRLDVLPFVLLAQDMRPPLEAVTERPDARAEKHVEYMLTWYSLAATVIVLWIVMNTKQVESNISEPEPAAPTVATDSITRQGVDS